MAQRRFRPINYPVGGIEEAPIDNLTYARRNAAWEVVTTGGASVSGEWTFSSTTTSGDPGTGRFRVDSATPANVTALYISKTDADGNDAGGILARLGEFDQIYYQDQSNSANFNLIELSGGPTDNGAWLSFAVTVVDSGATIPDATATNVLLLFGAGTNPNNVTSFNSRIGDVVPQESDYSAFFYPKSEADSRFINTVGVETKTDWLTIDRTTDSRLLMSENGTAKGQLQLTGSDMRLAALGASQDLSFWTNGSRRGIFSPSGNFSLTENLYMSDDKNIFFGTSIDWHLRYYSSNFLNFDDRIGGSQFTVSELAQTKFNVSHSTDQVQVRDGYELRVYDAVDDGYIRIYSTDTNEGWIRSETSNLNLSANSGLVYVWDPDGLAQPNFRVYNQAGTSFIQLQHDGTNSQIDTGSGNITLNADVDIVGNTSTSGLISAGSYLQAKAAPGGTGLYLDSTVNYTVGTNYSPAIRFRQLDGTTYGAMRGYRDQAGVERLEMGTGYINPKIILRSGNNHTLTGAWTIDGTLLSSTGTLSNGTYDYVTTQSIESGPGVAGNFGQFEPHQTYSDFNTEPTYWGWSYLWRGSPGPPLNKPNYGGTSSQFYRARISLGTPYGKGSDSGDYWLEMAIPRYANDDTAGDNGSIFIRTGENGVYTAWAQVGSRLYENQYLNDKLVFNENSNTLYINGVDDFANGVFSSGNFQAGGDIRINGTYYRGVSANRALHVSDPVWLRLNNEGDYTNGTYTPGNLRVDGNFQMNGGSKILSGSPDTYGSFRMTGSTAGWRGLDIDDFWFMATGSSSTNDERGGIYHRNGWMIQCNRQNLGEVELYHNGVSKFSTTTLGAQVEGKLTVSGELEVNTFQALTVESTFVETGTIKLIDASQTPISQFQVGDQTYGSFKVLAESARSGYVGMQLEPTGTNTHHMTFMSNGTTVGCYNDTDNQWMWYGTANAGVVLNYNGSPKVQTESTRVRLNGNLYFDGSLSSQIGKATGQYGTIRTYASGLGGYTGYALENRLVFMLQNGGVQGGIYDDINNEWKIRTDINNGNVALYYNGTDTLRTQSNSASGISSGATVRMHDNSFRDVGINVMPVYERDVNKVFDVDNQSKIWHKDSGGTITYTCNNTSDVPNGAMWMVANEDSEALVIAQGTGVTIRWWTGDGAVPPTGTRNVARSGIATIYKYSNTEYWIWGIGIS